jgi:ubiquinone/menaquinone biosynthesis C-methylase UbiE
MGRITGRRIAGVGVVAGIVGMAHRPGRATIRHAVDRHTELFVGKGSVWYDRLAPLLLGRFYRRVAGEIVAAQHAGVVLDVGCGPGHLALLVARRAPHLVVQGVDISSDMVRLATQKVVRAGLAARVRFQVVDGVSLPYADESIDLAVATMSMHHWSDVPAMLRELARAVRSGGAVWIYDVWQPNMGAAAVEATVPELPFTAPQIAQVPVWLGPLPLRHAVRCTLVRRGPVSVRTDRTFDLDL